MVPYVTGQVHLELYIAQTGACWNTLPQSRERRGTGKQKREKERTPARMGSKPRAHKRHPSREGDHEVYRECPGARRRRPSGAPRPAAISRPKGGMSQRGCEMRRCVLCGRWARLAFPRAREKQAGSKLVQLTAVLARPSGAEVGGTAAPHPASTLKGLAEVAEYRSLRSQPGAFFFVLFYFTSYEIALI